VNEVFFDGMASFSDWGIYLSSIVIDDPKPKEIYVDIPNGDGALDLTEALTGEVHYESRPFEAVFTIKPETYSVELVRYLRGYLNGKQRTIRTKDEPGYYVIGRCATSIKKDGVLAVLTVKATCQPWKYKNDVTAINTTIGASGTTTLNLTNERKRVIPTITASAAVTVVFNGQTISVNAGTQRLTNITLRYGDNLLTITGAEGTTVLFEYQEGAL
jgi:phage-related protein